MTLINKLPVPGSLLYVLFIDRCSFGSFIYTKKMTLFMGRE